METPKVGTISEEEIEFNNMIGSVELNGSSITGAIMDRLYGPYTSHSPYSPPRSTEANTTMGSAPLANSSIFLETISCLDSPTGH